ncbi:uncharacterized protein METZ01_LOCUS272282 [marine metagenome]|uniref:Uncharacterized protein n=1 Tax=marine metagenome TaxID=408172 RepID=A0A382K590_9ZZZZ
MQNYDNNGFKVCNGWDNQMDGRLEKTQLDDGI